MNVASARILILALSYTRLILILKRFVIASAGPTMKCDAAQPVHLLRLRDIKELLESLHDHLNVYVHQRHFVVAVLLHDRHQC